MTGVDRAMTGPDMFWAAKEHVWKGEGLSRVASVSPLCNVVDKIRTAIRTGRCQKEFHWWLFPTRPFGLLFRLLSPSNRLALFSTAV